MFIGSFFILYSTVVQFTASNTLLDMRTAYWITKVAQTFTIRNTCCVTAATVVTQKKPQCYVIQALPVLL
jgi:hypothetical protein